MSLVFLLLATSGFECLVSAKESSGLLLAGGNSINSAQIWTKDFGSCALPSLHATESGHTIDSISGSLIDCHGTTCNRLIPEDGWEEVVELIEPRVGHTSAILADDLLLLVGGRESPSTTELVDIAKGKSTASFNLQPGRQFHCSIQLTSDTVVLTGGLSTETLVTEISNLGEAETLVKELPALQEGRRAHACGSYTVADSIFMLVTGGTSSLQHLASTEVISIGDINNVEQNRFLNIPAVLGASLGSFHCLGATIFSASEIIPYPLDQGAASVVQVFRANCTLLVATPGARKGSHQTSLTR